MHKNINRRHRKCHPCFFHASVKTQLPLISSPLYVLVMPEAILHWHLTISRWVKTAHITTSSEFLDFFNYHSNGKVAPPLSLPPHQAPKRALSVFWLTRKSGRSPMRVCIVEGGELHTAIVHTFSVTSWNANNRCAIRELVCFWDVFHVGSAISTIYCSHDTVLVLEQPQPIHLNPTNV